MNTELSRYFKNPFYWITLLGVLFVRLIFAHLDRLHRSAEFWILSGAFWDKLGSAAMCLLILAVLIRFFSVDQETKTLPIINSTARGRGRLFFSRLIAGIAAVAFNTGLTGAANSFISLLLGKGLPQPEGWIRSFARSVGMAVFGGIGLFIVAACVCDMLKNQPAAICICGVPFVISYFVNASVVKPFDLFWFFRYGFFTELMRGRAITSYPAFWAIWYTVLLFAILLAAIQKRKERKEL